MKTNEPSPTSTEHIYALPEEHLGVKIRMAGIAVFFLTAVSLLLLFLYEMTFGSYEIDMMNPNHYYSNPAAGYRMILSVSFLGQLIFAGVMVQIYRGDTDRRRYWEQEMKKDRNFSILGCLLFEMKRAIPYFVGYLIYQLPYIIVYSLVGYSFRSGIPILFERYWLPLFAGFDLLRNAILGAILNLILFGVLYLAGLYFVLNSYRKKVRLLHY